MEEWKNGGAGMRRGELMLVGFKVKCGVIADCSQCPSVCLSVVSVSPLSLSLFISHSVADPMFSSPASSPPLLTSQFVSLPHLNRPLIPFVSSNELFKQIL